MTEVHSQWVHAERTGADAGGSAAATSTQSLALSLLTDLEQLVNTAIMIAQDSKGSSGGTGDLDGDVGGTGDEGWGSGSLDGGDVRATTVAICLAWLATSEGESRKAQAMDSALASAWSSAEAALLALLLALNEERVWGAGRWCGRSDAGLLLRRAVVPNNRAQRYYCTFRGLQLVRRTQSSSTTARLLSEEHGALGATVAIVVGSPGLLQDTASDLLAHALRVSDVDARDGEAQRALASQLAHSWTWASIPRQLIQAALRTAPHAVGKAMVQLAPEAVGAMIAERDVATLTLLVGASPSPVVRNAFHRSTIAELASQRAYPVLAAIVRGNQDAKDALDVATDDGCVTLCRDPAALPLIAAYMADDDSRQIRLGSSLLRLSPDELFGNPTLMHVAALACLHCADFAGLAGDAWLERTMDALPDRNAIRLLALIVAYAPLASTAQSPAFVERLTSWVQSSLGASKLLWILAGLLPTRSLTELEVRHGTTMVEQMQNLTDITEQAEPALVQLRMELLHGRRLRVALRKEQKARLALQRELAALRNEHRDVVRRLAEIEMSK